MTAHGEGAPDGASRSRSALPHRTPSAGTAGWPGGRVLRGSPLGPEHTERDYGNDTDGDHEDGKRGHGRLILPAGMPSMKRPSAPGPQTPIPGQRISHYRGAPGSAVVAGCRSRARELLADLPNGLLPRRHGDTPASAQARPRHRQSRWPRRG